MVVGAQVVWHRLVLGVVVGAKLVRQVERRLVPRSLNLVSKIIEGAGVIVKCLLHGEGLCGGVERLARGGELAKLTRVFGVGHRKSLGKRLDGCCRRFEIFHLKLGGQTLGERLGHVLATLSARNVLVGLGGAGTGLDNLEEIRVIQKWRHRVNLAEEPGVVPQIQRLARVVDFDAILANTLAQGVVQARPLHKHLRVLAREGHSEELLLDGVLKVEQLGGGDAPRRVALQTLVDESVENLIVLGEPVVAVEAQGENVFLGLGDGATLERIHLGDQVVEAAAEGPGVRVFTEVGTLVNKLGGGVVNVAREIRALEQFFIIVGQAHHVELEHAVVQMQASRVHVAVDNPVGIQVSHRGGQLAEQGERVESAEFSFAELLPGRNVVGALRSKHDGLRLVNYLHWRNQV